MLHNFLITYYSPCSVNNISKMIFRMVWWSGSISAIQQLIFWLLTESTRDNLRRCYQDALGGASLAAARRDQDQECMEWEALIRLKN